MKQLLIILVLLSCLYSNTNTNKSQFYKSNTVQTIPYDGMFFDLDYSSTLLDFMNNYTTVQQQLLLQQELVLTLEAEKLNLKLQLSNENKKNIYSDKLILIFEKQQDKYTKQLKFGTLINFGYFTLGVTVGIVGTIVLYDIVAQTIN